MKSHIGRYGLVAGIAAVLTLLGAGIAFGAWVVSSDPAIASAHGGQIPKGVAPTARLVTPGSNSVALQWKATTINGHGVAGYQIRRHLSPNGTSHAREDAANGCGGIVTATACTETGVPDGIWRYTVTPVQRTWTGAESAPGNSVTVYVVQPSVSTSYPAASGAYGMASAEAAGKSAGCPDGFCGRIVYSAVATVSVRATIQQDGSTKYWRTSTKAFDVTNKSAAWIDARVAVGNPVQGVVGTQWSIPFPTTGITQRGSYTLHVVAEDSFGRTGETTTHFTMYPTAPVRPVIVAGPASPTDATSARLQFSEAQSGVTFECSLDASPFGDCASPMTYPVSGGAALAEGPHTFKVRAKDAGGNVSDAAAYAWVVGTGRPAATNVQATNAVGGTAGRLDSGDSLTLTYSRAINPGSVSPGWDGSQKPVTVRVTPGTGGATDTITVYDGAEPLTSMGTVDLKQAGYVTGSVSFSAVVTLSGPEIVVVLGNADSPARILTAASAGFMEWSPGPVTDLAGLALSNPAPAIVIECAALDQEF